MSSHLTGKPITPVILAGGTGSRLFPHSTPEIPKQFILRSNGTSLFQDTFTRLKNPDLFFPPLVIANKQHHRIIRNQAPYHHTILYEPIARNTGAAVLIASLHLLEKGVKTALICPSDHIIQNKIAFNSTIEQAQQHLENHAEHVLFGIFPDHPSPEFGYIQTNTLGRITCFHEKPTIKRAQDLINSTPNTYWNSGIFALNLPLLIRQMRDINGDFLEKCKMAYDVPTQNNYADIPSTSFDKLYLEHCPSLFCLKAEFDWMDIGMQPELLKQASA